MCDIMVNANDLWDYCIEYQEDLVLNEHEIARNPELGIKVFVTIDELDEDCFEISVEQDGEDVGVYEFFSNPDEAFEVAEYVYETYVDQSAAGIIGRASEYYVNDEDRIYERESELDDATANFLDVAYSQAVFGQDEFQAIKNHFLGFLANEFDSGIYRPCYMVDDEGQAFIEDYPYEIEGILGYPDEDYEFDDMVEGDD